jgi:predicted SpoU family rRNA methylase
MNEIRFLMEDATEGSHTARAFGADSFTGADDLQSPHASVRDAVHNHCGNTQMPFLLSQFTS